MQTFYLNVVSALRSNAYKRILPFAVFIIFLLLADLISKYPIFAIDVRYLYPAQILAVMICIAYYWSAYTELNYSKIRFSELLLSLAVGVGVFFVWISFTQPWAVLEQAKSYNPYVGDSQQFDYFLLSFRLLGSALVVPIVEELFWRSFLMRWIDRSDFLSVKARQISLRAIIITAILFALEHIYWFSGLIAGLAYNLLYWRTGNLWLVIFAHAVTNAVLGCWLIWNQQWQFW